MTLFEANYPGRSGTTLEFDVTRSAYSGGQATVSYTCDAVGTGSSHSDDDKPGTVVINGVSRSFEGPMNFSSSRKRIRLTSGTVKVSQAAGTAPEITVSAKHGSSTSIFGVANTGSKRFKLPRVPYAAPGTPTPSLSSPSAGSLSVSWAKPSGTVTGYDVRYSTSSSMSSPVQSSTTSRSWSKSGLTPGDVYYVQVRAKNADATGSWSAVKSVTLKLAAPGTPSLTLVSNAAGQLTASWAKPSGTVSDYDLQIATNAAFTSGVQSLTGSSPRTVSGLTPGGTYYGRVRAKNADATGSYSTARSVVVEAAAPSAPAAPTVRSDKPGEMTVTWAAPSSTGGKPIVGYDVRYSASPSMTDPVTLADRTSPLTVAGLRPGASLWVQVRARNADQPSAWSTASPVRLLSGMYAGVAGSYVPCEVFVGVGGQYVQHEVLIGAGGAYVPAG